VIYVPENRQRKFFPRCEMEEKMRTVQSTINNKKKAKQILVFIFILLGIFMMNAEQPNGKSSGSKINCLSNPDPWNSLSYSCAEKEVTIPSNSTKIEIVAGGNGAIAVKGWDRKEIKIRILSETWAESTEEAKKLLESVSYKFADGKLIGEFSKSATYRLPWAVSFEIMVPNNYDVNLSTGNGAIYVDELKGNISANAVNGAVYLNQVSGKVNGKSVNGRVEANIGVLTWDGDSLNVVTENGDVAVFFPKDFSAQLNTETERGKIFIENQVYSFNVFKKMLNDGGKPITARSENGNILVYFKNK
jgi:hypothetical protein